MYGSRLKTWLKFLVLSFVASLFAMMLISMVLYHNNVIEGVKDGFIPSIGAALLFSMVVFMRPQN